MGTFPRGAGGLRVARELGGVVVMPRHGNICSDDFQGLDHRQLQRALAKRDVLAVRSLAGELPSVPLPIASEITVLLLECEPESYAPAARRLLAGVASERAMPLRQLADLAVILTELEADPAPRVAGKGLVASITEP